MAAVNPVRVGLIFLGAAATSLFFGFRLMRHGLEGFRKGTYPLTDTTDLKGLPALAATLTIMTFGALCIVCGIATLVFAVYRLKQLLG